MIKSLSVFFPCFNEEGNIENTVKNAIKVLENLGLQYEITIVDDGSTDKTGQIADGLTKRNPKVKVIHHQKNLGYGEALKSGFYNAKYATIVYTDGDGQFDFSEVTKFLGQIEDNDLIIGYRIKRRDPFFRIVFKKGWKLSLLLFFGLTLKDVDCGFKMIKRKVLEKIPHLESTRGAMINAELAIKTKKYGFKVTQVGVNHYPRLSGKPTGANLNVIIKSFGDLLKLWWALKEQKLLFLAIILVLILAAFLRFYKLDVYMTFLGDEGRDVLIIKKILLDHDLPFIGPPTSVGNIYLGPLYYYMMTIPMAIFWLNPVAAAGMMALIGTTIVAFIYYLGKVWFGKVPGLIAAFLYAISPVTITYSRSSWNPNPTPFFALLGIWSLYKAHHSRDFRWFILTGAALAAALQMHYLALLLLPIFAILWLYELFTKIGRKLNGRYFLVGTIGGVVTFWLLMLPLILFDLKHNFLNFRAITEFLTNRESLDFDFVATFFRIPNIYVNNLIGRYISSSIWPLTVTVLLLTIFPLLKVRRWPQLALGIWLTLGIVGLSFYKSTIYDHYLGFLNPAPFLLLGASFVFIKNNYLKVTFLLLIILLTIVNLQKNPLRFAPNNQLGRTQDVARFIVRMSNNKPFNFALLAKNNYDSAYQFYLDKFGHKPKQVPFEITDQLFVVCEDPECAPINNPKYEIAAFGWAKIEREEEFSGVKVFKLVHNPSGRP